MIFIRSLSTASDGFGNDLYSRGLGQASNF